MNPTPEYFVVQLVTFNETVSLPGGTIKPVKEGGFRLEFANEKRKPKAFPTALPAVRALLKIKPANPITT